VVLLKSKTVLVRGAKKERFFPKMLKHKCINKKGNPERHYGKILWLIVVAEVKMQFTVF
jgi:hypothetical protein